MGLPYKSKYTTGLNLINHMMTQLVKRDFITKIIKKADLHNPFVIFFKFRNQIYIKYKSNSNKFE